MSRVMWDENTKLYRAVVARKKNIGENPAWTAYWGNFDRRGPQPAEFLFSDTETTVHRYGPYLVRGAATQAMKREAFARYRGYGYEWDGPVVDKWVEEIPIPPQDWKRVDPRGR